MIRPRYLFIFILIPFGLLAQQNDSSFQVLKLYTGLCTDQPLLYIPSAVKPFRQLQVSGQASFNSSFVDAGFASSVFNNQFIDVLDKDRVQERMFEKGNFLQIGYSYGIQYAWQNDSSLFTHQISLTDKSATQVELTKGLYRLVMYGNGANSGLVDLGYNELFDLRFRQLGYNVFYRPMPNLIVYGSLGIQQGLRYHHAYMAQASLNTYDYGEKIDLRYRFSYAGIEKPEQNLVFHYTGFSFSGGAVFSSNPSRYQAWVGFNDISTINTRSYTSLYVASAEKTFEGVEVNNLFDITDTTFSAIDSDSLLRYLEVEQFNTGVTDALPFYFQVGYKRNFNKGYFTQLQASYYTAAKFHYPLLLITAGKTIGCFEPALTGSVGGYRQGHLGLQLLYHIGRTKYDMNVLIRTHTIDALIFPDDRTALNATAMIQFTF